MPMTTAENTERKVIGAALPVDLIGLLQIEQTIDRRISMSNTIEALVAEAINARREARGEPPIGEGEPEEQRPILSDDSPSDP